MTVQAMKEKALPELKELEKAVTQKLGQRAKLTWATGADILMKSTIIQHRVTGRLFQTLAVIEYVEKRNEIHRQYMQALARRSIVGAIYYGNEFFRPKPGAGPRPNKISTPESST